MGLEGKNVYLREQKPEDLPHFRRWRNDLLTQAWTKILPPCYTDRMYENLFEKKNEFDYNPKEGRFSIIDKENKELAGLISYGSLEERHSATIGLILDKKFWGKGHAFDAQEVLLHFLFCELGLKVVRLWTNSWNKSAVGLAKKSGFKIAICMKEGACLHGTIADNLLLDLLADEYFQLHPDKTSPYTLVT